MTDHQIHYNISSTKGVGKWTTTDIEDQGSYKMYALILYSRRKKNYGHKKRINKAVIVLIQFSYKIMYLFPFRIYLRIGYTGNTFNILYFNRLKVTNISNVFKKGSKIIYVNVKKKSLQIERNIYV